MTGSAPWRATKLCRVEDGTWRPARPGLAAVDAGADRHFARSCGAAKASESEGEVEGQAEDYVIRTHPHVHVETVQRGDFERPGGRRFGALVHALLGSIDLDASADAVQASAAINGRIVSATEEEVQAAIVTVGTALGHPILRRAAASAGKGELRRETPVLLTLDDGSLVEGVVDLAFRDDTPDFAGWTVVDFKTDREFAAASAPYIAEVRVYSEAVGAATGSPTRERRKVRCSISASSRSSSGGLADVDRPYAAAPVPRTDRTGFHNVRVGIQIDESSSPKGTALPSRQQIATHAQTIASSLSSKDFMTAVLAPSFNSGRWTATPSIC